MTGVSVTGIFGLKWFSRYPPSPLPLSLWLWQEIYKHFLLWKHTFVADTGWINEFVSGYLRLISLIFQRSLMCDLKTNPCLMEGQRCVLVIFFKYLSPAHFLINTLAKLYITITAVYTASRCFCFIIYLIILSSQSTRRCCQNLNHYHLQRDSAPRDCNPSWPVETAAFERNFVSASRVAPHPSRGHEGASTLHSADREAGWSRRLQGRDKTSR